MAEYRWVEDGCGSCWVMCDREDCDLHVVRPGKAQCKCEFECPCGGEIAYHLEPDARWPGVSGWFCTNGGPFCEGGFDPELLKHEAQ